MLAPDARAVAMELLRPPSGHRLDRAVLTTYSLDLEALLALPLAVLAHADEAVEDLLADPLLVMEALREAGERLHVFVDHGAIAIPRAHRSLYALLEACVHPARAPHRGAFHPKVWVARFLDAQGAALLRVAVLSRNLTFDRSWDLALASEAAPSTRRRRASGPLAQLLRRLPDLTLEELPEAVGADLEALARDVERSLFPAPDGLGSHVTFHALGLGARPGPHWRPREGGMRLFAVAPFVKQRALEVVAEASDGEHILVSRQDTLDELPEEALARWDRVLVLSDAAAGESEDAETGRPSGLHAKAIAVEHGHDVTWWAGSANLTDAAFTGSNVEMMASVTGRKGRRDGRSGYGIERFIEGGFLRMCEPYRRADRPTRTPEEVAAARELVAARRALVEAELSVHCAPGDGGWQWTLRGELDLPESVEVAVWPVTLAEDRARPLALPSSWALPTERLSAFVAFRLSASGVGVPDERLVRKLPAEGLPEGRVAQVLRLLIDDRDKLLRFLRALLGGLDELVGAIGADGDGRGAGGWGSGLGGETLLEDLLRAASRDPERLEPVRRLLDELCTTEEGRALVPEELLALWRVVDQAVGPREEK